MVGFNIFAPPEAASSDVDVWPENWPAFDLFAHGLGGQWVMGFGGPVALNYLVLHRELDDLELTGEARALMKRDIRAMEQAALAEIHKGKR